MRATAVAFSVSDPSSRCYSTLRLYNKVHINIGDDFCPETGIFTCSKAGVYYFITTLVKKKGVDFLNCSIVKNDSQVQYLYLDRNDDADAGNAAISNSVVLSLSVGDRVFLGRCTDLTGRLEPWSSFSGFLLYPLT